MSIKLKHLALAATTFAAALIAQAPAADETPRYTGWSWSGDLGRLNLTKDAAAREYLYTDATVFGFGAEHYNSEDEFIFGFGLDFVSYNDAYPFQQLTNQGWKESNASGMIFYGEAGARIRLGVDEMNYLTVKGGYSATAATDRSIASCSNCDVIPIKIDGGLYGVVGIGHSFSSVDLALNFQQYFSGDFDNSITLKLSSTY